MRKVKCLSGIRGWRGRLRENYSHFEEFQSYSTTNGLHLRLGYHTPEKAWEANPEIEGSVNPSDYRRIRA